jgi:hypothetical protein
MSWSWDDVLEGADVALDIGKVVAGATPLGAGLQILDMVVESQTKDVKIENSDVIDYLQVIAKSTGNGVDDKLICMVKSYIECDKKDK